MMGGQNYLIVTSQNNVKDMIIYDSPRKIIYQIKSCLMRSHILSQHIIHASLPALTSGFKVFNYIWVIPY